MSIAAKNVKELRRPWRTGDLQANRTFVRFDRQYKLQEATAPPFGVDRLGRRGQDFARWRKPPTKTVVDRHTFLCLRQ